jgi:Skp family chaperone for outer membrane proteins
MTEHHDHRDDCPFKFATLDVCDCVEKNMLDRIEALETKLATCEKYRDAYAECDRIGTQAVRDLETKLAKAVGLLGKSLVKEKRDLSSTLYEEISDFIEEIAEIKGESHD